MRSIASEGLEATTQAKRRTLHPRPNLVAAQSIKNVKYCAPQMIVTCRAKWWSNQETLDISRHVQVQQQIAGQPP